MSPMLVDHRPSTRTSTDTPRPERAGPAGSAGSGGSGRTGQTRRRRRGPLLLAAVLVLALLAGLGGWYFGYARYVSTPGVVTLSEAAATTKVEQAGLQFKVGREAWSETVEAGSVISTDPAPGSRILKGGTVTAVLSLGPERYEVPVLRGLSEGAARLALTGTNLVVGDVTRRYSDAFAQGEVLRSDPKAGKELRPGGVVDFVVSKGPRPIEVPDFTGRPADRAESVLTDLGLKVTRSEQFSDSVREGRVITQDPSSGTLFKGDRVNLTVSRGPELVEVPNVLGMGVEAATAKLEAAGFQVSTEHSTVYVGLEYVVSTDPSRGTMAPRGSTVTISLV